MKWLKRIDSQTYIDSVAVLRWLMKYHKSALPLDLTKNLKLADIKGIAVQKVAPMTIARFKALNASNAGYQRLQSTPARAYPKNNRPRGQKDLDSVEWHMAAKKALSPIVVLCVGKNRILLDGVHRAVAANILGEPISVALVSVVLKRK